MTSPSPSPQPPQITWEMRSNYWSARDGKWKLEVAPSERGSKTCAWSVVCAPLQVSGIAAGPDEAKAAAAAAAAKLAAATDSRAPPKINWLSTRPKWCATLGRFVARVSYAGTWVVEAAQNRRRGRLRCRRPRQPRARSRRPDPTEGRVPGASGGGSRGRRRRAHQAESGVPVAPSIEPRHVVSLSA